MKTGSLRARVILTTLALFAIVLAVVVTAVTLAYRAELEAAQPVLNRVPSGQEDDRQITRGA